MKKIKRISAIISLALSSAFFALPALAQINTGLEPVRSTIGLGTTDIRVIVARVIYVGLGLLGTVLLVIILYAGFLWMTAGGDESRVEKAKKLIMNGVIGLAIVLSSYAITYFVVTRLMGVRDSNGIGGPGNEQSATAGFGDYGTGAMGEGAVQSHFPSPGATNIARNTKIIITFKLPIDPTTIISGGALVDRGDGKGSVYTGTINLENARLVATADLATSGAFQTASNKLISEIQVYTVDNKTFVLSPNQYLGSPTADTSYTVAFGSGVRLSDGRTLAFSGSYASGYKWEFSTGTTVDTTAPQIISVTPSKIQAQSGAIARNVVLQITFNEAVDPTSATGVYSTTNTAFSNVTVATSAGRVEGTWEPANQYKTISFRSAVRAGSNSCGDPVYVLPGGTTVTLTGLSATVGDTAPLARFYPPDGITDLASNSLDGNGDGIAQGPLTDNFVLSFNTSNVLDLTPPRVDSTDPSPESGGADLSRPVLMTFNKQISIASLNNQNLVLETAPKLPLWYYGEGVDLRADGSPITNPNEVVARTQGVINHERLAPTVGKCSDGVRQNNNCAVDADCPAGLCIQTTFSYYPKATSGVTDIYQNCFLPACGDDPSRRYCCPSASGNVSCRTECAVETVGGQLYCDESKP